MSRDSEITRLKETLRGEILSELGKCRSLLRPVFSKSTNHGCPISCAAGSIDSALSV